MKQQIHLSTIKLLQRLSSLIRNVFKYIPPPYNYTSPHPPVALRLKGEKRLFPPLEGAGRGRLFPPSPERRRLFPFLPLLLTLLFALGAGESWGQWKVKYDKLSNALDYKNSYYKNNVLTFFTYKAIPVQGGTDFKGEIALSSDNGKSFSTFNANDMGITAYSHIHNGSTTEALISGAGSIKYFDSPNNQWNLYDNPFPFALTKSFAICNVSPYCNRTYILAQNTAGNAFEIYYQDGINWSYQTGAGWTALPKTGIEPGDIIQEIAVENTFGILRARTQNKVYAFVQPDNIWVRSGNYPANFNIRKFYPDIIASAYVVTDKGVYYGGLNGQLYDKSANCMIVTGHRNGVIGTDDGIILSANGQWSKASKGLPSSTKIMDIIATSTEVFAIDQNNIIYSRPLLELKFPAVDSVTSTTGKNKATFGEQITIKGSNLNNLTQLKIGNVIISSIINNTDTEIVVSVPDILSAGDYPISITTNDEVTGFFYNLSIVSPKITTISPATIFEGEDATVTIQGQYFSTTDISVKLGGQDMSIAGKPTDKSVSFLVPSDIPTGSKIINLTSNGKTVTSPVNLTITRPTVSITSPKTGDRWLKGETYKIRFESTYDRLYRVELLSNGNTLQVLSENAKAGTDINFKVTDDFVSSNAYSIRVTATNNNKATATSSTFTIIEKPPLITDFKPKEGFPSDTVWIYGKNFNLFENKVFFGTVEAKLAAPPRADTLVVTVPELARGEINLIVNANNQSVTSKDKFKVIQPFIQMLRPSQGNRFFKDDTLSVIYRTNVKGNVRVELLNGGTLVDILANSVENNGRFLWNIPADIGSSFAYRLRISSVINPSISGITGSFAVTEPFPVIESVAPLTVGGRDTITITGRNLSLLASNNVIRIGGILAEVVAIPRIVGAGKPPLVSLRVRVPDRLVGSQGITLTVNNENQMNLPQRIEVLPPFITLTSPNGGESWIKGNIYEVTWNDNVQGAVRIELLFQGTSPRVIATAVPSNGRFLWSVPFTDEIPEGNFYKIKITSLENLLVSGTSKENFFISEAPVTILDFRPKAAPKGAIVSIQGTNFKRDSPAQPLRVKFGDFSVPVEDIEYVSPNLIRAIVPESVNFDSAQISLSTAGVSLLTKDFFKIVPPFIRLLRPRGGESFDKGVETPIVYESNIGERVRIELLRGDRLIDVIRERVESTNSFNWFVPLTLRAGTDYRLRITSTRQANIFALSNPFTILPTDLQPPTIFNASFENFFTKGSRTSLSLQIQARDQDEEGSIRSVVCFYKGITQTNFKQATCAASDINFTANIPESEFDEIGLEYYFVATDMSGKTDRFPRIGTNQTYLRFGDLGLPINYKSFGTEILNYEILAIPLVLEKNTVADVFSKTLGDYNPRRWRMFQLKENDTSYVEMSDISTIDIGKGYWLIAKNETEIYTGVGRNFPANSNSPFILKTQKGANLIGNPYHFDLDWEKVVAFNRGRGVPELFVFEGGTWKKSNVLKKFRGGFIFNAFGAVDIAFPVSAKVGNSGRTEREVPNPIDKPNWEVQLNLQAGNYRNELGGFGMNEKASLGIDVFDRQPIPQLLANLATNFTNLHEGNTAHHFNNVNFTKSIIPSKDNFIWHFSVQSTFEGVQTLSWENDYFGQNGKQLFLYDEKAKRLTNMRKIQSYSFEGERNFKIFFGDKNFINNELPELKASVFVYPNPFADDLHLSINVPENETSIMFGIYDVAGKLMRLENKGNLRAGVHEIILEGKNNFGIPLKSGAYLLQIHIGQSIEAWKVVKE